MRRAVRRSAGSTRALRRVERQVDAEHGARRTGRRVDEADGAAVQGGDPAGDGQARGRCRRRPRCSGRRRACRSARRRARGRRAARPGRRRRSRGASASPSARGADPDRAALGAVADGVVEQVDDQLPQPGPVGPHGEPVGRRRRAKLTARPVGTSSATVSSSSSRHVDVGQPQRRHAGVDPGELEQVADQVGEPAGLADRGLEVLLVGGHDAVGEVLQHGGQAGRAGSAARGRRWRPGRAARGRRCRARRPSG